MVKKTIYLLIFVIVIGLSQTSVIGDPGDLLQVFRNPDPAKEGMFADRFGSSIAIAGNRILIGATGQGGNLIGAVYLFDLEGNLLHTFESQTQENYGQFGLAVAALEDDILISGSGEVYLFDSNSYSLKHTFTNPTGDNDAFGYTIAALNNKIFISALHFNNEQGRVYIFDANTYQLVHTIENPYPEEDRDQFGFALAASSGKITITSKYHNTDTIKDSGVGCAYLFDPNGTLLSTFNNPEPNEHDQFGQSAVIVGEDILIGADGDDSTVGITYLFDPNGSLKLTITNPNPDAGDWFGQLCSTVVNRILVGAPGEQGRGAAYLYNTNGVLLLTYNNPNSTYDSFGNSITSIGGDALIAAPDYDEPTGERAGIVYLYEGFALGDFEPDGDVDANDLAVFTEQWLRPKLSMDIAPGGGDGTVNFLDWAVFADGWQDTTDIYDLADFANQWLQPSAYCADIAPAPDGDGTVNMLDFAEFAKNWLNGIAP